jgi:hypothetical protein
VDLFKNFDNIVRSTAVTVFGELAQYGHIRSFAYKLKFIDIVLDWLHLVIEDVIPRFVDLFKHSEWFIRLAAIRAFQNSVKHGQYPFLVSKSSCDLIVLHLHQMLSSLVLPSVVSLFTSSSSHSLIFSLADANLVRYLLPIALEGLCYDQHTEIVTSAAHSVGRFTESGELSHH